MLLPPFRLLMRLPSLAPTILASTVLAATVSVASAHDFWLVPNAFAVRSGATLEIAGRTSSRFPTSESAVARERVQSARILSATREWTIGDLSVEGKALRIRHRPESDGQYLVAVALVARESRTMPERLWRYIALEGAPALAERYRRERTISPADSVTQVVAKYAKTLVEIGRAGPTAYTRRADHALEMVPLNDARSLLVNDSLRVHVYYRGAPLRDAQLFAGGAVPADSVASGDKKPDVVVFTDSEGRASIPLGWGDLWNVRTVHAAVAPGGDPQRWEVLFATLVVQLASSGHGAHRR